ncbi:F-box protein At2g32560 [Linum grandiflorum]
MMILYFIITCFSFIFLLKPHQGPSDFRLFSILTHAVSIIAFKLKILLNKVFSENHPDSAVGASTTPYVNQECRYELSMLDLPELALDNILERLSPAELCNMAGVCTSLRERCTSDDLWERHMKQKWSKIIGPAASKEWQLWHHQAAKSSCKQKGWLMIRVLSSLFRHLHSWLDSNPEDDDSCKWANPSHHPYAWYLALESGRFWFPAQVYNRENGHVGFLLSCYDADLSYDPRTDTFQARYPPHGRRPVTLETGVQWERLRATPIDTSCSSSTPHCLHVSDCLNDLCPGDHIEIQWRRNKDFPYGWWYGVVGHLQECGGNEQYCRCHYSGKID